MYYVTMAASPHAKQVSIDDFLSGNFSFEVFSDRTIPYTRTICTEKIPWTVASKTNVNHMISKLEEIASYTSSYDLEHMERYYRHYEIPKKSGGKRPIDEPNKTLKEHLKALRTCLECDCNAKWHTAAYAYVPGRSTYDEREFHAKKGSRWFEYLDFHNFFGSFTFEFAWETICKLYPFCMIVERPEGRKALEHCLKLCFLHGGLPQGTPISPMLTNLLMIPFDFEISRKLRHGIGSNTYYYARYADDICISCSKDFDSKEIEKVVLSMLEELGCPFVLNTKKTHYCSFAGHNVHLGLTYNKDKNITVGWKKKDQIKAALTNYALDTKNGARWSKHDAQILMGQFNYCRQQEKDYFEYVLTRLSEKFGIDIEGTLRAQLKEA